MNQEDQRLRQQEEEPRTPKQQELKDWLDAHPEAAEEADRGFKEIGQGKFYRASELKRIYDLERERDRWKELATEVAHGGVLTDGWADWLEKFNALQQEEATQ